MWTFKSSIPHGSQTLGDNLPKTFYEKFDGNIGFYDECWLFVMFIP